MLNELKIDELLGKVDSRYGLVLVAARRAREINEYAATLGLNESLGIPGPQVHTRSQHPLSISFEELREGKLDVGFKQPPKEADEEGIGAAAAAGDDYLDDMQGLGTPSGSAAVDTGVAERVAIEQDDPELVVEESPESEADGVEEVSANGDGAA